MASPARNQTTRWAGALLTGLLWLAPVLAHAQSPDVATALARLRSGLGAISVETASGSVQVAELLRVDPGTFRDKLMVDLVRRIQDGERGFGRLPPEVETVLRDAEFRDAFLKQAAVGTEYGGAQHRLCNVSDDALTKLHDRLVEARVSLERRGYPTLEQIEPFQAAPPLSLPNARRIVAVGDTGTDWPTQWAVAGLMNLQHAAEPFDAFLHLGDAVYPHAIPWLFDIRVRRPYEPIWNDGVPGYLAVGNHGAHFGGGWPILKYFNLDQRHYKLSIADGQVDFFFVDTNLMIPGQPWLAGIEPWAETAAAEQTRWLDQALGESTARMKIVIGHHPMLSSGKSSANGQGDQVRAVLHPLLKKHGVQMYLTGHDHHYERSVEGGITHMISGAGGRPSDFHEQPGDPKHTAKVISMDNQYVIFEVTDEGLRFEVIPTGGREPTIDEGLIPFRER